MLKQGLYQKQQQKLSPLQIQIIKMLELPTIELEQRIKKELEENPALEANEEKDITEKEEPKENSDEFSLEDYINEEDIPSYKLLSKNYSVNDEHKEMPNVSGVDFKESLKTQLGLKKLNEQEYALAEYLIGSLDDDGFLRREIINIVDDLAFSLNIITDEDTLERLLKIIQDFDPAGVGARNLQECLLIQLSRKNENEDESIALAKHILSELFDAFTKKHYDKIIKKLDIDNNKLKDAINVILKLNPKPGSSFGEPQTRSLQAIIPDFILDITDEQIGISLNSRNAPELRISRSLSQMLETYAKNKNAKKSDKDTMVFIKQKLDSAKWFIDAIVQRQNTLLYSMNTIAEFQKAFFLSGDERDLKPMILKDIAEVTGLDISTISRVANSKYVATPYGNYSLKYFFSEGMQTESGEEVSTREIKHILKDCIAEENKSKPLTDDKLAAILKTKGYQIARRTVAKYREQLDIPVARLRKKL